ncbi:MAG: 23S rRNA pseudouridine(955/2504/2580) synthase, partial [Enterobacteriaceae bacterium]
IVERFGGATLVRAMPLTGRTHQIRVHTQYTQHPIAFDSRYGNKEFDSKMAETGLNRLFLHAERLSFTHPHDGKAMRIEAPLDSMLQYCLGELRKNKKQ